MSKSNIVRSELFRTIHRLLEKSPSLRLAQLIGNATPTEEAKKRNNDLYYVEDKELLGWLLEYERKIESERVVKAREGSNRQSPR